MKFSLLLIKYKNLLYLILILIVTNQYNFDILKSIFKNYQKRSSNNIYSINWLSNKIQKVINNPNILLKTEDIYHFGMFTLYQSKYIISRDITYTIQIGGYTINHKYWYTNYFYFLLIHIFIDFVLFKNNFQFKCFYIILIYIYFTQLLNEITASISIKYLLCIQIMIILLNDLMNNLVKSYNRSLIKYPLSNLYSIIITTIIYLSYIDVNNTFEWYIFHEISYNQFIIGMIIIQLFITDYYAMIGLICGGIIIYLDKHYYI